MGTPSKMFGETPFLGEHAVPVGQILADSLDWEQKGAVTSVKNQGSCGSCWSFGSMGSMEGHWFLSSGTLTSLSEQQLVVWSPVPFHMLHEMACVQRRAILIKGELALAA